MKVLFATTNPAKIKRYAKELENRNIEVVTIKDLEINIDVEENGKDDIENAYIKAKAYYDATKLTTIAMDDNLYIEGLVDKEQPKCYVRRVNGKRLNDDEMIEHYINIAHKLGGQARGYWLHGIAICKDGKIETYEKKSYRIFTDKASKTKLEGYPLASICISEKYNKYRAEMTEEEISEEQNTENKDILDFIINNI